MKTKEELSALKAEVENLNKKLTELSEEELAQVEGGGYDQYGHYSDYSSKLTGVCCPVCDEYSATFYYKNGKCVKITCPCGCNMEDENGL